MDARAGRACGGWGAACDAGIVAAMVFAFIACWTEFFFALILTSRTPSRCQRCSAPFSVQGAQYGESSALSVVSLVPSIALGISFNVISCAA